MKKENVYFKYSASIESSLFDVGVSLEDIVSKNNISV
jgi:hypothetical protein